MTFALTKVQCYGIESEEPLNKRYRQYMYLTGTGANTNVAMDFGLYIAGSLGTFWTAVGAANAGALTAINDIGTRAQFFDSVSGDFQSRAQVDPASTLISALTSAAYGGGSATPTLTVTGLLTTDTILGATQILKNQNSLPLIAAAGTCAVADQYIVGYSADPGTTGTVRVVFSRAAGTTGVEAGTYQVTYSNKTANLLFSSGDAPTTWNVVLKWVLNPGVGPVEYYAAA